MRKTTTLYLRGIPVDIVRSAKAAAALRGSTLGVVVSEALTHSLKTARARPREDVEPEFEEDMAWYREHQSVLARRYPNQYLAIVDGAVADHDGDFSALAERTFERYGDRPVFMPRTKVRPIRIRSPRRAS